MKNKSKITKTVNSVPEGYHTVTPYLIVEGASKFIEFLKQAFGGELTSIMKGENDLIMHATVKIGDSNIMVSDTMENFPATTGMLYLYVEDVDLMYHRAVKANAISVREPKDEFYGDRSAGLKDSWNNSWWIATHIEDVSHEELKKREKSLREQEVHA